jgi:hypothetical protein
MNNPLEVTVVSRVTSASGNRRVIQHQTRVRLNNGTHTFGPRFLEELPTDSVAEAFHTLFAVSEYQRFKDFVALNPHE